MVVSTNNTAFNCVWALCAFYVILLFVLVIALSHPLIRYFKFFIFLFKLRPTLLLMFLIRTPCFLLSRDRKTIMRRRKSSILFPSLPCRSSLCGFREEGRLPQSIQTQFLFLWARTCPSPPFSPVSSSVTSSLSPLHHYLLSVHSSGVF